MRCWQNYTSESFLCGKCLLIAKLVATLHHFWWIMISPNLYLSDSQTGCLSNTALKLDQKSSGRIFIVLHITLCRSNSARAIKKSRAMSPTNEWIQNNFLKKMRRPPPQKKKQIYNLLILRINSNFSPKHRDQLNLLSNRIDNGDHWI